MMCIKPTNILLIKPLKIILFLLVLFLENKTYSQFYAVGHDPISVKWRKVKTKHFKIIFPSELEDKAQYFGNRLEQVYSVGGRSLNAFPKPITVVLHNRTVISNGLVAWAPKRMELFMTPPQNVQSCSWFDELTAHEFRHVCQIGKMNQGLTKCLGFAFGQQAIVGVAAMVPRWFLEGDAVMTETLFSKGGRGRSPEFEMRLKAIALGKGFYSYDKHLNGSYKDFVPNHYDFGYQIVRYGRHKYGPELWDNTLQYVARNPYTIFPFYFGLKKETGLSRESFCKETFSWLNRRWTHSIKPKNESIDTFIYDTDDYVSYKFPIFVDKDTVLALKEGLSYSSSIVVFNKEGKEKLLARLGPNGVSRLSVGKGKLVWSEYAFDPRWPNRSYSIVKLMDLKSRKIKKLSRRSRYFAPSIDFRGEKVVTVNISMEGKSSLVIIDTDDGRVVSEEPCPSEMSIQSPSWDHLSNRVVCTFTSKEGKGLIEYSWKKREWKVIYNAGSYNLNNPIYISDKIVFRADFEGVENLYAYDKSRGQLYRITDKGIASFYPSYNLRHKLLSFSKYTQNGYRILVGKPSYSIINKEDIRNELNSDMNKMSGQEPNLPDMPDKNYEIKRYSKLGGLFNFHSWTPFFVDYDKIISGRPEIYPGVSFVSQNYLSTATTMLGYAYKNGYNFYHTSFDYKGLYPAFKFSLEQGGESSIFDATSGGKEPLNRKEAITCRTEVYVPLRFYWRGYYGNFKPFILYKWNGNYYKELKESGFQRGTNELQYGTHFYFVSRQAHRDFKPRTGFSFFYKEATNPWGSDYFGSIHSFYSEVYMPSFALHHSLKVGLGYEWQDVKIYGYSGHLTFARGYKKVFFQNMKHLKLDYEFPLFYPDWSIAQLAYLKRVRLDLFFDWSGGDVFYFNFLAKRREKRNTKYSSFGAELKVDWHALRTMFPLRTGVRAAYLKEDKRWFFEAIFGVDLYSLGFKEFFER